MIDRVLAYSRPSLPSSSKTAAGDRKGSSSVFYVHSAVENWGRTVQSFVREAASCRSQNQMILATSAAMSPQHRELIGAKKSMCVDKKEFFDHMVPSQLAKGAMRVAATQMATIYTNFLSDQLQEDMKRDELVRKGEISPEEAEDQADEWSETEWAKRSEGLGGKLLIAYCKFQAATFFMRAFELFVERRGNDALLERLTRDPLASAKRRKDSGQSITFAELTKECWDSNIVAYLADFTVQQLILTWVYITYVRARNSKKSGPDGSAPENGENPEMHTGSLVLSFLKRTTGLALSRIISLTFAAIGGAIGGQLYPGWGALAGINFGDGIAASMTEEFAD